MPAAWTHPGCSRRNRLCSSGQDERYRHCSPPPGSGVGAAMMGAAVQAAWERRARGGPLALASARLGRATSADRRPPRTSRPRAGRRPRERGDQGCSEARSAAGRRATRARHRSRDSRPVQRPERDPAPSARAPERPREPREPRTCPRIPPSQPCRQMASAERNRKPRPRLCGKRLHVIGQRPPQAHALQDSLSPDPGRRGAA